MTPRVLAIRGRASQISPYGSPNLPSLYAWEHSRVAQSTTLSRAPRCAERTHAAWERSPTLTKPEDRLLRSLRGGSSESTGSRERSARPVRAPGSRGGCGQFKKHNAAEPPTLPFSLQLPAALQTASPQFPNTPSPIPRHLRETFPSPLNSNSAASTVAANRPLPSNEVPAVERAALGVRKVMS